MRACVCVCVCVCVSCIMPTGMHVGVKSLSRVRLFVTPWTVARQAPPSMGFSRQEYLKWVAISFSRGSSRPRDWTRVSHIPGTLLNVWATREVHVLILWVCVSCIVPAGKHVVGT